jgi:hypothetical protein
MGELSKAEISAYSPELESISGIRSDAFRFSAIRWCCGLGCGFHGDTPLSLAFRFLVDEIRQPQTNPKYQYSDRIQSYLALFETPNHTL